jgi:DNA-binding CsgD family transcriptional regulator
MQWQGAWPDALDEAQRACERFTLGFDQQSPAAAFYQQAEVHRLRGEFTAAEEAYRNASQGGWEPQPGLALLWLAQGRIEAADAAIRRVLSVTTDQPQRTNLLPAGIEIMLAGGASPEAREACCELEEIAERFGIDVLSALAAHARGAVALADGEAQAALGALRHAWQVWQKAKVPYLAARVRVLMGLACRALGDEDGGRLELDAARAVFAQLGAAPDLAWVDSLRQRAPSGHPQGLTPRELQVLRLVATGKTNKAIATELCVSEKTVDRHVSNIFTKLHVPSRAAATAYAYEHKLI